MRVETTSLPGVLIVEPKRFGDHRGFFSETWSRRAFAEAGIDADWAQDNHSMSAAPGTLRGLHFQHGQNAQAKLVRVVRGAVFDVAVDLRRGSPTYGQWTGAELSAANWRQLYIPAGFAHGFVTLEPDTEFVYKCSAPYDPGHEGAIVYNDPDLAIDWPLPASGAILSEKDAAAGRFADLPAYFQF